MPTTPTHGRSLLVREATGCDGETARDFLESRHSGHFADDVVSALSEHALADAITAATMRWMDLADGHPHLARNRHPARAAYLTGFVLHAGIEAEAAAKTAAAA